MQGNVGDLVAKDDSQMSAAHLIGTALGVYFLSFRHDVISLFGGYALLAPCHLFMTIKLLRSTRFAILNSTSLPILADSFIRDKSVLTLYEMEKMTNWFSEWPKPSINLPHISIGSSIEDAFNKSELNLESTYEILHVKSMIFKDLERKIHYFLGRNKIFHMH